MFRNDGFVPRESMRYPRSQKRDLGHPGLLVRMTTWNGGWDEAGDFSSHCFGADADSRGAAYDWRGVRRGSAGACRRGGCGNEVKSDCGDGKLAKLLGLLSRDGTGRDNLADRGGH